MNILSILRNKQLNNSVLSIGQVVNISTADIVRTNFYILENSYHIIPAGTYNLRERHSDKFKKHYEITGIIYRKLVLFHPGEIADHSRACLITGLGVIESEGQYKMRDSRKALNELLDLDIKKVVISNCLPDTSDIIVFNPVCNYLDKAIV